MTDKIDLEIIKSDNDVFLMLDSILEKRDQEWWDKFYADRSKSIPFFVNVPDENLSAYIESGVFKKGKILDIGCGNGRNSIYLAKQDFDVQGVDFSASSIEWAIQNANEEKVDVKFTCKSIFDCEFEPESFDYIYDSGCLHHIKPHRREQYLKIVSNLLKPDGYFGLVCFNLKGGANISDYDVYREYSMCGGLGFSEYKLKTILEQRFLIDEFREMKEMDSTSKYGKEFLWSVLMKLKLALPLK